MTMPYLVLGAPYREKLQIDQAVAQFKRAAELAPKTPVPPYQLARTYLRAGRLEEAKVAYRQALAIDPKLEPAAIELRPCPGSGNLRRRRRRRSPS